MTITIGRFPFVSKADIVRIYRPGIEASEGTFRTLRRKGLVSHGTDIRLHRHGRVSGQLRCYSALNLDSAVLARHGHHAAAVALAERADVFESAWSATLSALAAEHDISDFDELVALRVQVAPGLGAASAELEEARDPFQALLAAALHEQFARVAEVGPKWATLEVIDDESSETATQIAVDAVLARNAGLGTGDYVVIRLEHTEGGSFVSLLAAIADTIDDAQLDAATSAYFSDEPLSDAVRADVERRRSDGLTVAIPPRVVTLAS